MQKSFFTSLNNDKMTYLSAQPQRFEKGQKTAKAVPIRFSRGTVAQ